MRRILHAPLLHFLALGGVLLGLHGWLEPGAPVSRPIIGARDVARLRAAWIDEHGASPTAAAEQRLVDDEILYREALTRGFDRDDAVRERLVRLGSFVGEDGRRDRAALEEEARRLGLERSDVVIRRHLIEMMRLAIGSLAPDELPTDLDLESYLARHAAEFAQPGRIRLRHVYLHGERTAVARELLEHVRRDGVRPDDAVAHGDAFIWGAELEGSRAELARIFGTEFADALDEAPLQTWIGPVTSSYGTHLVWIAARHPARMPPLAAVRGRVIHGWLRERREAREREEMATLRSRYVVRRAGDHG